MKLHKIKIGNTIHVCDTESLGVIQERAMAALTKGQMVKWEDGSIQWINGSPIIDIKKDASQQYIWDESGRRVLCSRILMTRVGNEVKVKELAKTYRIYERVFDN